MKEEKQVMILHILPYPSNFIGIAYAIPRSNYCDPTYRANQSIYGKMLGLHIVYGGSKPVSDLEENGTLTFAPRLLLKFTSFTIEIIESLKTYIQRSSDQNCCCYNFISVIHKVTIDYPFFHFKD